MVCNFDPTIHKKLERSREVQETPKFEICARHLDMEHSKGNLCNTDFPRLPTGSHPIIYPPDVDEQTQMTYLTNK